eukprot:12741060-Alexandrium_andersonii.AAC.2
MLVSPVHLKVLFALHVCLRVRAHPFPRQVTKHFDCPVATASSGQENAAKAGLQHRQKQWVKRSASAAGLVLWKKQKRHRVSAKHFVLNIDNQVFGVEQGC